MKQAYKKILFLVLPAFLLSSCAIFSKKQQNQSANDMVNVKGTITEIVSGTDGYTATINADDDNTYKAVISFINLQKSGGTYKGHQVGDKIVVSGQKWSDDNNNTYIKVTSLNDDVITVSGQVTAIHTHKDGYTAVIKDDKNQEYHALISIVNLNRSGNTYKKANVNDNLKVKGDFWIDINGVKQIKVTQILD